MREEIIKKLGTIYWDSNDQVSISNSLLRGHIGDITVDVNSWDGKYYVVLGVDMQSFTDSEIIEAKSIDELKVKISEYVARYILDTYFEI